MGAHFANPRSPCPDRGHGNLSLSLTVGQGEVHVIMGPNSRKINPRECPHGTSPI